MKKKKEDLPEPSAPFWMTTYGDMVTLLLTFFILLISFSTIELQKFRGAIESLKGALGVFSGHESPQSQPFIDFESLTHEKLSIAERSQRMENLIESFEAKNSIDLELTPDGIKVRLGDDVLFDLGQVEIKSEAYRILSGIMKTMENQYKEIVVEGHTDDIPIHTERFPSNWELSAARALSVVKYLHEKEKVRAEIISAVGHGEHRPMLPNTSDKNRAKNRRVEIFIKWK